MNDMTINGITNQPTCCEENRKEISTLTDRVMWLMNEVNTFDDKLKWDTFLLQQRIAYLELPWWKKLWK